MRQFGYILSYRIWKLKTSGFSLWGSGGCLLIYLLPVFAIAGKADTIQLSEVLKVEKASTHVPAYESPFTDLQYQLGESTGDALKEYSSVYIKDYGNGQLASLAIRGTSAEQTEIQWNGVRINSPMLGQVDLNLLLIGMQDEIQMIRTGYEGTIGGTLKLDNAMKADSGFMVNATLRAGSFNKYAGTADIQYSKTKFWEDTKFSYLTAENNFPFRNSYEYGNPYTTETNAATRLYSFLQQFGCKINDNNELNFYVWLSGANRQIPPVMSSPISDEGQDDYSARAMANWKGTFRLLKLQFTSAYLYDLLHFTEPEALINDISGTQAIRNILSASYLLPCQLALNAALNYDHEQANTADYTSAKHRETIGLRTYADYYLHNKFRFHGGFRQDLVGGKLSVFAPEFSFNYNGKISRDHFYSAGLISSRDFRFPTFNDLYWNPGGNPNLKEERSWNGELQFKYSYRKIAEVTVSNFYLYVDDWIQWIPQGAIWMPVNYREVFSRGLEAAIHLTNQEHESPRRLAIHFNASYTYTKTTNLDAASQYDLSKGMQLIYVPYNNLVAGLQLSYYRFYIRCVNTYTGSAYTTSDNSQSLGGYFLTNIEIGKDFLIKRTGFGCSFKVNNVANVNYQVVAEYPMPGRNYEVTLRFKFS